MKRTNRIKVYLLIAILSLSMIFAIACTEDVSVTGLSITGVPENGIVTITDTENTLQLGVKFDKGNGKVHWTSGDEDVATIDGNGKVTLIDSGVVVITATFADNSENKVGSTSYGEGREIYNRYNNFNRNARNKYGIYL